jgi:RNA polymerase sigma-70 factor (ECF subfamily)
VGGGDFERETLAVLPDVMRFAKSLESDHDAAGDLVQETYLRAYDARSTFDVARGVRPWLFAICRNIFLRSRERSRWMVAVEDDAELEALAMAQRHNDAVRDGCGDAFATIDFGPALARAMASLSEPYRVVVALVDVGELSYAEAAEQLGIPVGTVRSRLFAARRRLQAHLLAHARDAGLSPTATEGRS